MQYTGDGFGAAVAAFVHFTHFHETDGCEAETSLLQYSGDGLGAAVAASVVFRG